MDVLADGGTSNEQKSINGTQQSHALAAWVPGT
jgi:hypothetical protein